MLSPPGVQVQSLVWELRSHKICTTRTTTNNPPCLEGCSENHGSGVTLVPPTWTMEFRGSNTCGDPARAAGSEQNQNLWGHPAEGWVTLPQDPPCSCPSWPVNGDPPEAMLSWRIADGLLGVAPCAFSEAALRRPGPHPMRTWRALQPLRQAHSRSCTCGRYSTLLLQKSGLPRLYLMSLETHPFMGYLLALGPPGTNLP